MLARRLAVAGVSHSSLHCDRRESLLGSVSCLFVCSRSISGYSAFSRCSGSAARGRAVALALCLRGCTFFAAEDVSCNMLQVKKTMLTEEEGYLPSLLLLCLGSLGLLRLGWASPPPGRALAV
jgi:hypothetical protein